MRLWLRMPILAAPLFLLGVTWAGISAKAERRIALVVTNQEHAPELMPLQFPHSDGRIVSAALKEIGFDVRMLRDGSVREFNQSLDTFAADVRAAGPDTVAVFYFSGHCWPHWSDRTNWLILNETLPEARNILDGKDVWSVMKDRGARWEQFKVEIEHSIPKIGAPIASVTQLIASLETKASFVIVDSHLDVAEPAIVDDNLQGKGSKIARGGLMFVTQGRPGLQAADSNDFSNALAGALLTPGLDAQGVFKQVQVQVAEKTNGRQVPWIEDRLLTKFYFLSPRDSRSVAIPISTATSPDDRDQVERSLWKAIRYSRDPSYFRAYLEKFPEGEYSDVAKLRIEKLSARTRAESTGEVSRRIALVIGNANYKNTTPLTHTSNDASSMAAALRDVGFSEVVEKHDLERSAFIAALRSFGEAATTAQWAVVYYAGHGLEIGGQNYLVPIDAKLETESDAEDEAVPVARLFDRLADAKAVKIVILDACRDNPLATRSIRRGAKRGGGGQGLAKMEAETGTLIALAADPGQPAYDDDGDPSKENSPYATALLQHIREPRLDVRLMFGKVYDTMIGSMKGKQQPWIQAKLGGQELYFRPN
jgi:uncharacterized caspase-like protein